MSEPLTIAGVLGATALHAYFHLVGGAVHHRFEHLFEHLLEHWREAPIDPHTGLPRNHDLAEASEKSLRAALDVLMLELAGRLEPQKPWLPRLWDFVKAGRLGKEPLFELASTPHKDWLQGLREAIAGKALKEFHRKAHFNDEQIRDCLAGDGCVDQLSKLLAEPMLEWARAELRIGQPFQIGEEPSQFEDLVREGWQVDGAHAKRVTIAHAYCLFFREHLKSNPSVFRIYTANTLSTIHTRLDQQGEALTDELKALRDEVAKLAENPPAFASFDAWLTPQLGAINELLATIKIDLDRVARGQEELKDRQGDILAAITVLRLEMARGNPDAQPALDELTRHVVSVERKLDYLIGGLPITRFQLPDPPTHELQLLHAKQRAVTLVGRDIDLDALCSWVESPEPISARLLVGGAGAGKTRLAYELLLRIGAALPGWQAGLLGSEDLRRLVDRTHSPDLNWPAPTLLVMDYAQTAGPLAQLLRALTYKRHDNLPPLRLLLLERQPGDWFEDLLRQEDSAAPCPVRSLFHPPAPVPLTLLAPGELRRNILSQTLDKAATLRGESPLALPPEGNADYDASLARPLFDQPFNLMLAALAASELGLLAALKRERIELAEELARKELRRIGRFARTPGNAAHERALQHLAACATMERGFTPKELDRAVAEELAALKITWPDGPGDLAAVLRRALRGDRLPVAPVEPDFVGEALVLAALARPDGGGQDRWRNWCAAVERCCQRDSHTTPATLLHAFQNFGHQPRYGEPLLAATDALIRAGLADTEPGLLLGIERALPYQTVELRWRAVEVTRHLYERLHAAMQQGRDILKPEVARLANNLSVRLLQSGRLAQALAPAQEAVELFRALMVQNPDAFQPDLAMSLQNLANALGVLGRAPEALAPAQEGVELYRALLRQNLDAFQPHLARSLICLADWMSGLDDGQAQALALAQESVELFRALMRQNPDAFQPDLAMSLINLAKCLCDLGRWLEALAPTQEAVELYTAPARQNPDAFQPDLARSLHDLANVLGALGRPPEALAPAQEAVKIRRALARQNPDAFQPDLASSLGVLSLTLTGIDRRHEALAALTEAIGIPRGPFTRLPDAFLSPMTQLVLAYERAAATTQQRVDEALLAPVMELFKRMQDEGANGEAPERHS